MLKTFRTIRTKDTKLITRLDKEIFPDDHPVEVDCFWWIVVDAKTNKPAGFGGSYHTTNYSGVKKCILHRAGVLEKYRGNGLQRNLIKARVRHAKKEGCSEVITYTSKYNTSSANNLIKCGFLLYRPTYRWGWATANYWRKKDF